VTIACGRHDGPGRNASCWRPNRPEPALPNPNPELRHRPITLGAAGDPPRIRGANRERNANDAEELATDHRPRCGDRRRLRHRLVAEAAFGYRNTENDYKNLSRLSAAARREGTFPPLLDRTRAIERPTTFASPAEALEQLARWYRRDLLETQDVLPVIVVEKATLVAQVQSWFDEQFGIPVVALRGYASEALERQVIDLVDGDEREVAFLYAGDFDPTGEDIPRAFAENTGLDLRHVALTAAQVQAYGPPPVPGKASDSRAAGFVARHGELVQVELEALDPAELRALLAIQLQLLVDVDRVAQVFVRQDRERVELEELAEGWDAG
jgi:CheY-like chemotaxis protein